jgi:iron complex transport system permease protein
MIALKAKNRTLIIFLILAFILTIFIVIDLIVGTVHIPFSEIIALMSGQTGDPVSSTILFEFRIPKTIAALLAGSALSVSGLQMQTIFRNPLAGPDVLGVSSGASLGVALVVMGFGDFFISGNFGYMGNWIQIIAAWAGAGIVLFLIMIVSLRVRDIMTILILGILFGSAIGALVSILQYFSPQSMLKAFVVWSMGNLGSLTGIQLKVLSISLLAGFMINMLALKPLNVMMLGETYSKSMGVPIRRTRILVFLSTSLLSGSITAFCGPVAFVGIAVPHLARYIFNTANHYILIPATIILGSVLMLAADIISQLPGSGMILPINSVTAILGIPVVIWVIISNKRISGIN